VGVALRRVERALQPVQSVVHDGARGRSA
jgi:hypothetical protein